MRHLYSYEGPVYQFDNCIHSNWYGETYASSQAKARSNLIYQFKKEYGYEPYAKLTLDDKKIIMLETKDVAS